MTLNIREGDELTISGKSYSIARAPKWESAKMNTAGFRRRLVNDCTVTRTIKGSVSTVFTGKCTALDPVEPDMKRRMQIESPYTIKQTFIADAGEFVQLLVEDVIR